MMRDNSWQGMICINVFLLCKFANLIFNHSVRKKLNNTLHCTKSNKMREKYKWICLSHFAPSVGKGLMLVASSWHLCRRHNHSQSSCIWVMLLLTILHLRCRLSLWTTCLVSYYGKSGKLVMVNHIWYFLLPFWKGNLV